MGHNAPLNGPYMENYMLHVVIYSKGGGGGHMYVCICVCLLLDNNGLQLGRMSVSLRLKGQLYFT